MLIRSKWLIDNEFFWLNSEKDDSRFFSNADGTDFRISFKDEWFASKDSCDYVLINIANAQELYRIIFPDNWTEVDDKLYEEYMRLDRIFKDNKV